MRSQEDLLFHEAAHVHTFRINERERKEQEEVRKEFLRVKRSIASAPSFVDVSEERRELKRLQDQLVRMEQQSFTERWKRTSEGFHGEGLEFAVIAATYWSDGKSEARNGCVRAYGCNNHLEDIATFVEEVAKGNHDKYRELTNPNSQFYKDRIGKPISKDDPEKLLTKELAERWGRIYRRKIILLHNNNFITDEDFAKIKQ